MSVMYFMPWICLWISGVLLELGGCVLFIGFFLKVLVEFPLIYTFEFLQI
jgi:hypothetical protein